MHFTTVQEAVRAGRADGGETWEAEWEKVVQPVLIDAVEPPKEAPALSQKDD